MSVPDDDSDLVALGRQHLHGADKKRQFTTTNDDNSSTDQRPTKRPKLDDASASAMDVDHDALAKPAHVNTDYLVELNACLSSGNVAALATLIDSRLNQLATVPSSDPEHGVIYLSLMVFFKTNPSVGTQDPIWEILLRHLRTAPGAPRQPSAAYVAVLAANILYKSFSFMASRRIWPVEFVQAYLDDALGERLWCEDENARIFVDRVVQIFSDPSDIAVESTESLAAEFQIRDKVREHTLNLLAHHLSLPQPPVKSVIKVMASCCYWPQMRYAAVGHLDAWLGDSTVHRQAIELMKRVAQTCNTDTQVDLETVRQFCRLRVSSAQAPQFHEALQKLLSNHPSYAPTAIREFVLFDIFGFVDLNNANSVPEFDQRLLRLIAGCIVAPLRVEIVIASVIQELVWNVALAPVLKSNIRALISSLQGMPNFDFVVLSTSLLRPPPFQVAPDVVEHFLSQLVDVTCLSMLTCIPSALLTDISTASGGSQWTKEKRLQAVQWRAGAARVGLEATLWCEQTAVPLALSSTMAGSASLPRAIATFLRRLLLLDSPTPECFKSLDAVVPSSALLQLLPIEEDTIIRVILLRLKLGPQNGLSAEDALRILEELFVRATKYHRFLTPDELAVTNPLNINNSRIHEALFRLTLSVEPVLASKESFFRACLMLIHAAALNTKTLGRVLWDQVPTVRLLMEMIITKNFVPSEPQIRAEEENAAIDHQLAVAAGQSDSSSLLKLDVAGPARLPPLHLLSSLQASDRQLNFGSSLCASRDPDFVALLLQRQPTTVAPIWLGGVLQADPTAVSVIPAKTLVQMFHQYCCGQFRPDPESPSTASMSQVEVTRIGMALREFLFSNQTLAKVFDLVEYLLRSLGSPDRFVRSGASRALSALFLKPLSSSSLETTLFDIASGVVAPEPGSWFDTIEAQRQTRFAAVHSLIIDRVLEALRIETNLRTLEAFLRFWMSLRADKNKTAPSYRLVRSIAPILSKRWKHAKSELLEYPHLTSILIQATISILSHPSDEKLTKGVDAADVVVLQRRSGLPVRLPVSVAELATYLVLLPLKNDLFDKQKQLCAVYLGSTVPTKVEDIATVKLPTGSSIPVFSVGKMDPLDALTSSIDSVAVSAALSIQATHSLDTILSSIDFGSQRALESLLTFSESLPNMSVNSRLALVAAFNKFPDSSIISACARKVGSTIGAPPPSSKGDVTSLLSRRKKPSAQHTLGAVEASVLPLVIEVFSSDSNASRSLSNLYETILRPSDPALLSSLVHALEQVILRGQVVKDDHQAQLVCEILRDIMMTILANPTCIKVFGGDESFSHPISSICSDISTRFSNTADHMHAITSVASSLGQLGKVAFSADVSRSESCLDLCTRALQFHHSDASSPIQWTKKTILRIQQVMEASGSHIAAKLSAVAFASCCNVAVSIEVYQTYSTLVSRMLHSLGLKERSWESHFADVLLHLVFQRGPIISADHIAYFIVQSFFSHRASLSDSARHLAKVLSSSEALATAVSHRLLCMPLHELLASASLDFFEEILFSSSLLEEFVGEGTMRLLPLPARLIEPWEACKIIDLTLLENDSASDINLNRLLLLISMAKQREETAQAIMKHLSHLVAAGDNAAVSWLSSSGSSGASSWWPLGCSDSLPSAKAYSLFSSLYFFIPLEAAAAVSPDILQSVGLTNKVASAALESSPSPIFRLVHNLALKLGQKADLGEVVYLLLRKLILTHPSLAPTCLAPLLVHMLHGRAESLKQHHVQHKQRHSATKIVSGFFEEFVFSRQEHRFILFALGLADSMLPTFLNQADELLIPLLGQVSAVLVELSPFLDSTIVDGSSSPSSLAAQQVQLEFSPIVLKFADLMYTSCVSSVRAKSAPLVGWCRDTGLPLLSQLKARFASISRHCALLSDAIEGRDAMDVDSTTVSHPEAILRDLCPILRTSPLDAMSIPSLERTRSLFHDLERETQLDIPSSMEPLFGEFFDAAASCKILSPSQSNRVKNSAVQVDHLAEQIRVLFLRICVRVGRESPKLSTPISNLFLVACQELSMLIDRQSHAAILSDILKHAADIFFLAAHSSTQQDILVLLWKVKNVSQALPEAENTNGLEDGPSSLETVSAIADSALQQIIATMTYLR